jgi:Mrp family chromosome partitioning ATPase
LLATNEAQVLSRLMGQVAMVVKAGETPREAVKGAIELISKTAAVGLVLNHYKNAFGAPYHGDYYEHDRS